MKAELVAEYLTALRLKNDLTFEAIAERSKRSVSTVKNLCTGKTEDPRLDTVAPIVYAMGGSIDEMYNPDKSKDEIKETSMLAMKDIYENQLNSIKESCDEQISSIRGHYEQHREDVKENYEKRLSDKREIIDMQNAQIAKLEETSKSKTKVIFALSTILFVLFFGLIWLELMHPEHGWIRF